MCFYHHILCTGDIRGYIGFQFIKNVEPKRKKGYNKIIIIKTKIIIYIGIGNVKKCHK